MRYNVGRSGRSAARLARSNRDAEVAGSNPAAPTEEGTSGWKCPRLLLADVTEPQDGRVRWLP